MSSRRNIYLTLIVMALLVGKLFAIDIYNGAVKKGVITSSGNIMTFDALTNNFGFLNGRVGIGALTAPAAYKLYTVGATGVTGLLNVSGNMTAAGTITFPALTNGVLSVNGSGVVSAGSIGVTSGGTGTTTQFTPGSVVFAGASGVYSQNNSGLFWDNTNSKLGIGTTVPDVALDIANSSTGLQIRSGNAAGGNTNNSIVFGYLGNNTYRHAIKTRHDSGSKAGNAIDFYLWKYGSDASTTVGTALGMTILGNGFVGIGGITNPPSMLTVTGNASIGNSYKATAAPTNGAIIQGVVGIGTSAPGTAYALRVAGATGVSGLLNVSGNITAGGTVTFPGLTNGVLSVNGSGVVSAGSIGVTSGGTGTTTQFTPGSVVFAGASGVYSQDNVNFFWDNTNKRLGIGKSNPSTALDVNGTVTSTGLAVTGLTSGYAPLAGSGGLLSSSILYQGSGPVATGIAIGGTDVRGVLTVQQTQTQIFSANSDPSDSGRTFVMQNNSATNAANQYANITMQINAAGSLTGGRVLGDIRLVRETLNQSNAFFMFSAFRQDGNYWDFAKIGYDTSYYAGSLSVGKTSAPNTTLDVNGIISGTALLVNGATQYYRDTNGGSNITQQMGMRGSGTGAGSGRFGIDFNTGGSDVGLNFGVINSGGANNIRHSSILAGADTTTAGAESGHISFLTKPTGSALTERVRIDPNGTLGIGTTTAPTTYKLFTNGAAGVTGLLNVSGNITTAGSINGGNGITIAGGANVNNGTLVITGDPTGQSNLQIGRASATSGQQSAAMSFMGYGFTHAGISFVPVSGTSRLSIAFGGNNDPGTNTTYFTFNSAGSLGIGTTNPSSMLSVGSSSQFQVNSSGAIAAATGITSSGTITFSGLGNGVLSASSGVISAGTISVSNGGTGTSTQFTQGSVVFAGASGVYSQNNSGLFWDNTNNRLGIGTTTPRFPFVVSANTEAITGSSISISGITSALRSNSNNDTLSTAILGFSNGVEGANGRGVGGFIGYLKSSTYNKGKLLFGNKSTLSDDTTIPIRMVLDSTGYLGIGTTTPSTPLDVRTTGTASTGLAVAGFGASSTVQRIIMYDESSTLGPRIYFNAGNPAQIAGAGSGVLSFSNLGVGYGTTTPASRLTVSGNASVGVSYTGTAAPTNGLIVQGVVGIGTSAPGSAYGLCVAGAAGVAGLLNVSGNIISGGTITGTYSGSGASLTSLSASNISSGTLAVARGGTGTGTAFTQGSVIFAGASGVYSQDNAGLFYDVTNDRLGIGTTTPGYRLDINNGGTSFPIRITGSGVDSGVIRYENTGTNGRVYHVGSTSTGSGAGVGFSIYDITGSAPRLLLDANGNIGIGNTTAPSTYKLFVSGAIGATGLLNVSGNINGGRTDLNNGSTSAYALRLLGSGADGAMIRYENTGGSGRTYHIGSTSSGSAAGIGFSIYDVTGSALRLLIDANGTMGIGTNSAPSAYKLFVSGATGVTGLLNVSGNITSGGTITGTHSGSGASLTSLSASNISSGTLAVARGGTGTGTAFTQGSVIFAGASGVYSQNNSALYWDNTNNRLGMGMTTPKGILDIYATTVASSANIYFGGSSQTAGNEARFYLTPLSTTNQQKIALISEASGSWGRGKFHIAVNNVTDYTNATKADAVLTVAPGAVGIGKTNPATALDVAGTVTATGLSSSGTITFSGLGSGVVSAASGVLSVGSIGVTNGGTGTGTQFTQGSVVFAGASGVYSQNNANLFWDNTNSRLGVGTTTPGTPLDVRTTGTAGTGLAIAGFGASSTLQRIVFYDETATLGPKITFSAGNPAQITGGNLILGFNNVGVGYGTTTPASRLSVSGNASIGVSYTGTAAPTNGAIIQGNVGIGKTNPGTALDVNGTVTATGLTSSGTITFSGLTNGILSVNGSGVVSAGTIGVSSGGTGATSFTAGKLLIGNGTSAVTTTTNLHWDTTNGRLGLWATSPGSKLDVQATAVAGSSEIVARFLSKTSNNANDYTGIQIGNSYITTPYIGNDGTGNAWDMAFWSRPGTGFAERMRLKSSGKLGIGTTNPANYLSVSGNASVGVGYMGTNAPTNGLIVQGNVGIGKSNPSSALDVNGGINSTTMYITNNYADSFAVYCTGYAAGNIITATRAGLGDEDRYSFGTQSAWGAVPHAFYIYANKVNGVATNLTVAAMTSSGGLSLGSYAHAGNSPPTGGVIFPGKLGVGTATPSNNLTVSGNASIGASYRNVTAPTNGLIVQGNVGLGTTSPLAGTVGSGGATFAASGLDVNSSGRTAVVIKSNSDMATLVFSPNRSAKDIHFNAKTDGSFEIYQYSSSSTFGISAGGYFGIGTGSPGAGLFVSKYGSNDLATNYNSTAAFNVNGSDVNLVLGGYANGVNAAVIQSRSNGTTSTIGASNYLLLLNPLGGNVGVGTTSPGATLDVNGTAKISGNFWAPGTVIQVKYVSTGFTSYTSSSWTDWTGLSVSITPRSSTSIFKVSLSSGASSSISNSFQYIRLMRNIGGGAFSNITTGGTIANGGQECWIDAAIGQNSSYDTAMKSISGVYMDAPATTSALVYKCQVAVTNGGTLYLGRTYSTADSNRASIPSTLIVEEIAQ